MAVSKKKSDKTLSNFLAKNVNKAVKDLPSSSYHGLQGTWSSTQFKDILEDEELFIRKYVTKEIPRTETDAFDTGTYFHTGTLEPHKIAEEIAVYGGKVRRGKEWDKFLAANKGKCIIAASQKTVGDGLIKAVKGSPIAQDYLDGEPEVSLFIELVVAGGKIYAPAFGKVLTPAGWELTKAKTDKGFPLVVKVRADTLGTTYVSDLKSTAGNARSLSGVRASISKYNYDLSASLYMDMFSLIKPSVREFVWIFASKANFSTASYRATPNQILVGRAKYMRAMVKLADCAASNWEVVDYLREAEPLPYEMEWLRVRETDLL